MSYPKLRGGSGIQWPCTYERPDGTERLYSDGRFFAHPDECESYGRDLITGAPWTETQYRALNPDGKAIFKAAEYLPPHEQPSADRPFALITGRTIYHFHSRTKTARVPQLRAAAPEVWVECSAPDAQRLGLTEGDLTEISTTRGSIQARVRFGGIREGVLFVPFHYGYFDTPTRFEPGQRAGRAANELTPTEWDPVSKQPLFKTAAASLTRIGAGTPAPAPTTAASYPTDPRVPPTVGAASAIADEQPRAEHPVRSGGSDR